MIFSELYSAYYNTVAKIISKALDGNLNRDTICQIVDDNAFFESNFTILPSLQDGSWCLLNSDFSTPLKHSPDMPLTTLQKQWLKAVLQDPRIKLFSGNNIFDDTFPDVEPLFTESDFKIYDKSADGDNFSDPKYIENFQKILQAIKNQSFVTVTYFNRKNRKNKGNFSPYKLEYSAKDDKFRMLCFGRHSNPINLQRIVSVSVLGKDCTLNNSSKKDIIRELCVQIKDENKALERVLIHFAHFEKKTIKCDENLYMLYLKYYENDEAEIVMRILSFGPYLKVLQPQRVVNLIKDKLISQKNCNIK